MLDCALSLRPSRFWRSRNKLVIRRHDDQQRIGSVRNNDGSPKKPSPVIAGKEGHYAEEPARIASAVSFIAITMSACESTSLCTTGRTLRDQPRDEAAHPAAADDFLDMTQEGLSALLGHGNTTSWTNQERASVT